MSRADNDVAAALKWVLEHLASQSVPYQIVGGFAVRLHGGTRPLNDIDLYAPLGDYPALIEALRSHTVWGPEEFTDQSWRLVFMKIDFGGQRIEIGDSLSDPCYWNAIDSRWERQHIDYAASEVVSFCGLDLSVMPVADLIRYKRQLDREVDRQDIRDLGS